MKFTTLITWSSCLLLGISAVLGVVTEDGLPSVHHRVRRLIGGQNALPGDWPWMGSLRTADDQHVCGAVLISEQAALTAAHCNLEDLLPESIVLGEVAVNGPGFTRRTFQFIPHPDFDPAQRGTYEDDIALLLFNEPVQLDGNIQPATLGRSSDEANAYANCTVTGWGLINENPEELPTTLQVADVNIYDGQQCAAKFNDPAYVPSSMICGGNLAGGIDMCKYDSGGPMQCRDSEGAYEVIGIAAFSFTGANGLCGQPNNPAIYTRVSAQTIRNFIAQTLPPGPDDPLSFECPINTQLFPVGDQSFLVYTLPGCTLNDGSPGTVTCNIPVGTPVVPPVDFTCTCEGPVGAPFTIDCPVGDDTGPVPPVLGSCPSPTDIEVVQTGAGNTVITFTTPTCTSSEGDVLPVSCDPPTLGNVENPRQIACTCSDATGATEAVTCAVSPTLTVVPCPPTVLVVNGDAIWTPPDCVDNGTVVGQSVCTPPSGTDGPATVDCVCSLGDQVDTCTFTIFSGIVPNIGACPTDVVQQPAGGQVFVQYTSPTCTDSIGGTLTVECNPPPNSLTTSPVEITCTCVNSAGTAASITCSQGALTIAECPPVVNDLGSVFLWTAPSCLRNGETVGVSVCNPSSPAVNEGPVRCVCFDSGDQDTCDFLLQRQTPCDSSPCLNGGFCRNIGQTFDCTCVGQFTGPRCEIRDNGCQPGSCRPGLECRVSSSNRPGYTCHALVGLGCN